MNRSSLIVVLSVLAPACVALAQPRAEGDELKQALEHVDELLEAWDIEGATAALERAEQLARSSTEPLLYFRGRLAFEEGRYQQAVELLEAAAVSDRPGSYLRLAKDTHRTVKDHVSSESENFVVSHPKGKDEILVPYALDTLERIRAALLEDLGYAPPGKVRVEIVNDARELARLSTLTLEQIRNTGTIAICKFNKLMVTSPKAVVLGYDWQDTLAHEYIHLIVSRMSRNTVPIWLHEGLAKFLESRWRGVGGQAMSPSTLALLGERVRKDRLIPFEKMHPSIALLPTAQDAATAFAEVFFAIDLLHSEHGAGALKRIIEELRDGQTDRRAVELATGRPFAAFERAWLAHIRRQPFPRELIPLSTDEKKLLKSDAPGADAGKEKGREISFSDFAEVREPAARRHAHLGELLRERARTAAAAEQYGKAYAQVGDRYESISNKYALALLELERFDEAERVLKASLVVHPGAASTNVHLGRIHLRRKEYPRARDAYLAALASNPFDEEIHVALFRVHDALGDAALRERALRATVLLTGVPREAVPTLARALAREGENLAAVSLPKVESPGSSPQGTRGDAGTGALPMGPHRERTR